MDPVAVSVNMDYIKGWVAVNKMMHEGLSWSGHERNCCFLNTGGRRFADVSAASGLDFLDDARALAVTDWDHDGDLDLWLVNRTAPQVRFVRNNTSRSNRFLAIRLLGNGRTCNRDAIGARLEWIYEKTRAIMARLASPQVRCECNRLNRYRGSISDGRSVTTQVET